MTPKELKALKAQEKAAAKEAARIHRKRTLNTVVVATVFFGGGFLWGVQEGEWLLGGGCWAAGFFIFFKDMRRWYLAREDKKPPGKPPGKPQGTA